jgi:hypothetical protein
MYRKDRSSKDQLARDKARLGTRKKHQRAMGRPSKRKRRQRKHRTRRADA